MVIEKTIISNEPPAVKNVIWGKPVNNGFMLYYNNGGWKPFKLGDNGATVIDNMSDCPVIACKLQPIEES